MVFTVAVSLQSCAQKKEEVKVPEKVKTSFNDKFPNAKKVEWEKEKDTEWEAEFKIDGQEFSAKFSSTGEWMETEQEVKKSEVPSAVLDILDQNFTGYEIEEVESVETPSDKSFEFEIEVDEEEFEVMIDSNGTLTKKKELEENDED
jgi:hypothetical protein